MFIICPSLSPGCHCTGLHRPCEGVAPPPITVPMELLGEERIGESGIGLLEGTLLLRRVVRGETSAVCTSSAAGDGSGLLAGSGTSMSSSWQIWAWQW